MDKQKLNTSILILILLVSVFNIIPQAGGDITVTVYPDSVFPVGKFNFSVNPARNFRYIEIGTSYIRFNHTNISVWATNGVNVSINNIASSLSENEQFKFTATASTGTAWFNISGLTPFITYTVNRDSSSNIVCVANSSGGISFSESSWSSHTYTGSSGSVGSNLRSDGSYLYMTMEDGITPTNFVSYATATLDTNNTIEGKYSMDINTSNTGNGAVYFNHTLPIKPSEYSFKFIIKEIPDGTECKIELYGSVLSGVNEGIIGLRMVNDSLAGKRIYLQHGDAVGAYRVSYFTSMNDWNVDTVYTLRIYNIEYSTYTFSATLSNATASETILNKYLVHTSYLPFYGISFKYVTPNQRYRVFLDDWTVGTQSNISTSALWPWSYPVSSSVINETRATITGTINNDGSPLQNNSEFNNTVSVLYDTVPHNTTSYTYYFNESSATEQWGTNPYYMNDTDENTYASNSINRSIFLRPTGMGTYDQWFDEPVAGSDYDKVDDIIPDEYVTYIYRSLVGARESFALEHLSSIYPSDIQINYVKLVNRMISQGSTTPTFIDFLILDGTQDNGPTFTSTLNWANYETIWNNNFITGDNWTLEDINKIEIGVVKQDEPGIFIDSTQMYLEVGINYATSLFISHSGNSTGLNQNGNISKIEVRAKSNLSSGSYDGMISLQPVWNNTNGTQYNIFSSTSASWSDWIDITQDVNYSHPNWNDSRELRCRVIANLSSGIAFVGMVELRISINRTSDYAYNASNIGTYHTGDTSSIPISGLTPGQVYFYRTKINTSYVTSSSYFYGDEQYFLTKPYGPVSTGAVPINESCINISWTKGQGANTTILIDNSNQYPITPYDGDEVYNGTGTYFLLNITKTTPETPHYVSAWSYDSWTVNPTLWHFSDNYTEFNWSIVGFNVFNESNPSQAIGFDLEICNQAGTKFVYKGYNLNNTAFINITNIPTGANIYITISNTSYKTRSYVKAIYNATIYNNSYYLPPEYFQGYGDDQTDANTTKIYRLHVIDQAQQAITGATLDIKKYINTTGVYETIARDATNGYGDYDLWAIPENHYKVFASKTGYDSSITEWIPDPTFYGANYPKIIQMILSITPPPVYYWNEQITFTATLDNTSSQIYVNYTDALSNTTDWQLYIYNATSGALLWSFSGTNNSFAYVIPCDNTGDYNVVLNVNHSNMGYHSMNIVLIGYHSIFKKGTSERFDIQLNNYAWNPFGWSNTVMGLVLLGCFFSFGRRETYMSALLIGVLLLFMNIYLGFNTVWAGLAGDGFPIIIIFLAILMLVRDRGIFGSS